jgi:hypothetical protein
MVPYSAYAVHEREIAAARVVTSPRLAQVIPSGRSPPSAPAAPFHLLAVCCHIRAARLAVGRRGATARVQLQPALMEGLTLMPDEVTN